MVPAQPFVGTESCLSPSYDADQMHLHRLMGAGILALVALTPGALKI